MKRTLTPEQSKELLLMGVDRERMTGACKTYSVTHPDGYKSLHGHTFSLADLMELLPSEIIVDRQFYDLRIRHIKDAWATQYYNQESSYSDDLDSYQVEDELVDALFALAKWCFKEGYIKPDAK